MKSILRACLILALSAPSALASSVYIPFSLEPPGPSTLGGVFSNTCASHQWIDELDTSGNLDCTQPAASDLSDGTTGTGAVVRTTSPSIASPTISGTVAGSNTHPLSTLAQVPSGAVLGNASGSTANVASPWTVSNLADTVLSLFHGSGTSANVACQNDAAGTLKDCGYAAGSEFYSTCVSGKLYTAPIAGAESTITLAANTIYFTPVFVPPGCALTKVVMEVTTGISASDCDLLLYADSAGQPYALIDDAGQVSTASAAVLTISGLSIAKVGRVWSAMWCSAGITVRGANSTYNGAETIMGWSSTTAPNTELQESGVTYSTGSAPSHASSLVYNNYTSPLTWVGP